MRSQNPMMEPGSLATRMPRALALLVVAAAMLLGGTLMLWAYYGTAVFFEMVRAGWAACF